MMHNDITNENNIDISIWGRELELEVIYDCFEDESILPEQEEALSEFLSHPKLLEDAKPVLENYIHKTKPENADVEEIINFFKFVRPRSLFIKRPRNCEHIIALLCDYKYDLDNGIAIVFKNEQLKEIGEQDIIL